MSRVLSGALCALAAVVLGCFMAFFVFIVKAPWVAAAFAFYCVAALVLWWASQQ